MTDELTQAEALLSEVFGPRDGIREALLRWYGDPGFSVRLERAEGRAIAISVARIESPGSRADYSLFGEAAAKFFPEGSVGSFQTLAVLPEHRRTGVGERLSRLQLQWMLDRGCASAIGVCWDHGSADTSAHLFEKAGFVRLGETREFYLQGSRRTAHICPVCRGECRCRAILYGLRLRSD